MAALVEQRCEVFVPAFGNGPCDLIAVTPDNRIIRIETKFTSSQRRPDRWDVALKQTRPNRSGIVTRLFNGDYCDVLAVYVLPLDRVLFYTSRDLHRRNSLVVRDEPAHYVLPS